ncbi:MAG: LysR family transcriptional regulator [Steroidobacter sp.]
MKNTLHIRFRIDFNGKCSIGPGKIQLLEAITESGSLSQAARDMDMSYRRAWLLMDSLNNSFDTPVVNASTGGSGGGGATLTEFGRQLIDAYLALEKKLNTIVKQHMRDIEQHVRLSPEKKSRASNAKARSGVVKGRQVKGKQVRKRKRSAA